MNPFEKRKKELEDLKTLKPNKEEDKKVNEVDNLFFKCDDCEHTVTMDKFNENLKICPSCNKHYKFTSEERILNLLDINSFVELDDNLVTINYLEFPEYETKLDLLKEKTNLSDAIVTGIGTIDGKNVSIAVMDTSFLMGSMGSVVGERLTRLIEYATSNNLPLVIVSASGGARMQEGIISLMQMAKTSSAIKRHSKKNLLYISVLTHPTTGGVTASFASLGDIIIAEPKSLIGFAGPRVIEQTINQKLPEGFQSAEYLEENGFVDRIITRHDLKNTLSKLITLHM